MNSKHAYSMLSALLMIFALAMLMAGCKDGNYFVSDIYFTCANPEVFEESEGSGRNTYMLESQVQSQLILNLGITTGPSVFSAANPGKYSIIWRFSKNGGEERPIEEFIGSDSMPVAEIENQTMRLHLNKIKCLSDYVISAYANSKKTSFPFSVDSKASISNSLSLFYVNDFNDELDNSSLISSKLKKEMSLQVSTSYALLCKNTDKLGHLEIELEDNTNLKITENKTAMQSDNTDSSDRNNNIDNTDSSTCEENEIRYLLAGSKPEGKTKMRIRAGDKKEETFELTIEKNQDRLIADPPPELLLEPIKGGWRIIAKTASSMLSKKFSTIMSVRASGENAGSESESEFKMENKYYENGRHAGYYHDVKCQGQYIASAYYRKMSLRSESQALAFAIEKDDALQRMDQNALLKVLNAKQSLSSIDDDPIIKTIRISFPPLSERMEYIPSSAPAKKFSPYKDISLRVEIIGNSTSVLHPEYDWEKGWSKDLEIRSENCPDKILIKMSMDGIYGKAAGEERIMSVSNETQTCSCSLEYDSSYYDGSLKKHVFCLNLNNQSSEPATLYYCYSENGGKTFSALRYKDVVKGEQKILLDKPDSKGFSSKNIIFKAKTVQKGKRTCDLGYLNANNLKISVGSYIEDNDMIQNKPNVRRVIITSPGTSYRTSYAIADEMTSDCDRLKFISLKSERGIIEAIKATPENTASTITKYIWLKTENLSDPDSYPHIERRSVTLTATCPAICDWNKSDIWRNEGFFGRGICLVLTTPADNCWLRVMAYTENTSANGIWHYDEYGKENTYCCDWDMCFASYRYDRFAAVSFTRKCGYMDSEICEYCGGCRYGTGEHNSAVEEYMRELKKEWRCVYEI